MNVFLWVLQIALAAVFVTAGVIKATQPKEKLVTSLPWVEDFSAGTVRLIAILELLAAIGLILPAVTGIPPVLTPVGGHGPGDRDGPGRQYPPPSPRAQRHGLHRGAVRGRGCGGLGPLRPVLVLTFLLNPTRPTSIKET